MVSDSLSARTLKKGTYTTTARDEVGFVVAFPTFVSVSGLEVDFFVENRSSDDTSMVSAEAERCARLLSLPSDG